MDRDAMTALEKLRFVRGVIFEAIVSTYTPDGRPNAAPMGVVSDDMRHLAISPFTTTQTFTNLKRGGCAVVNFVADASTFYKTAFKNEGVKSAYGDDFFKRAEVVDAPQLKEVDALLEVSVVKLQEEENRAQVICRIDRWERRTSRFQPYCRGGFAAIEAIIHATRIRMFLAQGSEGEARRLMELVEYYQQLIARVAPDSEYSSIIEDVIARIDVWKEKSSLKESSFV
ncbi:MAG: DUF447 family protein [Candidatus Bathyarchaeota archaeon]|nr:DUF447 family protein [Candidatus Bathyarchaeota archaeon]